MTNLRKLLIGTFCFGVFLTGIGSGVAFSEFSSFRYAGKTTVGEVELKTSVYDFSLGPAGDKDVQLLPSYNIMSAAQNLTLSEEIPEGILRFVVTYNAKAVEPYLSFDYGEENDSEPYAGIYCRYLYDNMALFMESKDILLSQIRNHEISSFTPADSVEIEVMVHPASADRIR